MPILKNKTLKKLRKRQTSDFEYDVDKKKPITLRVFADIMLFIPLTLVVSFIVIIIASFLVPSIMGAVKKTINSIAGGESVVMRGVADYYKFDDVEEESAYFDSANYLKRRGIIAGYIDNTYKPEQDITRAELVKSVVKAKNRFPLAINHHNCFADVNSEWYAPSICYAKEEGWIGGYEDNTFRPTDPVSKAQALKILIEAFDVSPRDSSIASGFQDVDQDAWYYSYVSTALSNDLIIENPYKQYFNPEDNITRGEVFNILYKILLFQN